MRSIFYDTETSGTDGTFDQIFQFAAVLADEDLREIDSFSVRCRRLPHIVPSPGALLATGLTPGDITDQPLSHYEMMVEICRKLTEWSRGGAMFLGWNSLRFDETFLRQAYYQTLLPIYQTNTSGNSRGDVMRTAQACSIYAPAQINVPTGNRGGQVFKLGEIASANGVVLEHAHEALADTRATLGVAKVIREKASQVWTTMVQNARKAGVEAALAQPAVSFSDVYFGTPHNFVVTDAARNPEDASEIGLFDLHYDPEPFLQLPEANLLPWITGKAKAVRCVRANSQPMLFPLDLAPENIRGGRQPNDVYRRRADLICRNRGFQDRLGRALTQRFEEKPPSENVEERIFDGFAEGTDVRAMDAFHNVAWDDRLNLCEGIRDQRYRELAKRLLYVERPDLLSAAERTEQDAWVSQRLLTDEEVPWLTVPKALREVEKEKRGATADKLRRLAEIEEFLSGLARRH